MLKNKNLLIKKLKYRASYTSMKETDLLLKTFCDLYLNTLNLNELLDFENLLNAGDDKILFWVKNKNKLPKKYDNKIFNLIINLKTN